MCTKCTMCVILVNIPFVIGHFGMQLTDNSLGGSIPIWEKEIEESYHLAFYGKSVILFKEKDGVYVPYSDIHKD